MKYLSKRDRNIYLRMTAFYDTLRKPFARIAEAKCAHIYKLCESDVCLELSFFIENTIAT